jgi:hypothetical protein
MHLPKIIFPWRARKYLSNLHWIERERFLTVAQHRAQKSAAFTRPLFFAVVLQAVNVFSGIFLEHSSALVELRIACMVISIVLLFYAAVRYATCGWRYLRLAMFKKGVRPALCFECDYSLEGTHSISCPECGCRLISQKVFKELEQTNPVLLKKQGI